MTQQNNNIIDDAEELTKNTISQGASTGSSLMSQAGDLIEAEKDIIDNQLMNVLHSQAQVELANNLISSSVSSFSLVLGIIIGYIVCKTMK